jgi:tartrate dehydrogenase/decarboxylase/D-malate dehydrogenase
MTDRTYRIALIPGDGVGKEVVPAARQVLEALPLRFDFVDVGRRLGSLRAHGHGAAAAHRRR